MEKRREERRRLRLLVSVEPGGMTTATGDLSIGGLFVRTARVLRPGTKVRLLFITPKGPAWAEGIVRWTKRVPPHLLLHVRGGMGVEITAKSPEWTAYLEGVFPTVRQIVSV